MLIDDLEGYTIVLKRNISVTRTLAIMERAAERGLIDFQEAARRLQGTTYRIAPGIIQALLDRHRPR